MRDAAGWKRTFSRLVPYFCKSGVSDNMEINKISRLLPIVQ